MWLTDNFKFSILFHPFLLEIWKTFSYQFFKFIDIISLLVWRKYIILPIVTTKVLYRIGLCALNFSFGLSIQLIGGILFTILIVYFRLIFLLFSVDNFKFFKSLLVSIIHSWFPKFHLRSKQYFFCLLSDLCFVLTFIFQ